MKENNERTLNISITLGLLSMCIGSVTLFSLYISATRELDRLRKDREQVAIIEKFIEKHEPNIKPAARRGYAEWTVETRWPMDMNKY